ncbi:putative manganese-dependent inorganic diphosphatase [Anaerorhabdus furcosa]|uniref:inorganic diphosphatase n=1 Tax=Anaerorhabdus furcosa TaxID=118967 RepID=A0A1T4JXB1_9FIRM|nr:putative manganese-dependent inorganic diphosphatase [Anaerorhabdus furcosa]SJZ34749.1 manganese-dependent inorganic pyrophosphatase [Anaerorhabdus furcosa]
MDDKLYVVGHKNPDSDSICSALAYANLKRELGEDAIACRLGPLNDETKFILKKFNLENPLLLKDARSQLMDIEKDNANLINEYNTMKEAWSEMLGASNRSLAVIDDAENLVGIVSTSNLAMTRLMLPEEIEYLMRSTNLESVSKTVNGKIVLQAKDFELSGKVFIITLINMENFEDNLERSICIMSDGILKQRQLIEAGAKCLIITCGQDVDESVLRLAKASDCAIVQTDWDTMNVAKVINEAFPIKCIMTPHAMTFNENEFVDDVAKKMMNTRFRSYPVLNDEGKIVGAVSRYHLQNYRRKKFILVDHSAKNQAINNIEEADIQEIIDHHHIGNIETDHPIYYRNQRCGCTATIISQLYQENHVTPNEQMAGILLSAIISDTLHFKSATTTELDKKTAKWLAELANINIETYAIEMLSASVALKDATPSQILNRDLKSYDIGKYHLGIGQTNYHNIEDLQKILPEFRKNLEVELQDKKLDLLVMMFTHVMAEGTMFVYCGPLSYIMSNIIETQFDDNSGYDHDIISRKQQLMPKLSSMLKNM